ncbi:hypothetical protein [Aurantiacibacter gilvus]|uniref:Methyl-accepting transducer domain-containing protein n=1 Tax=Aurantiacibacter gilvus TaxID=3139141 RepID=A0ABU9I9H8_9SPHN
MVALRDTLQTKMLGDRGLFFLFSLGGSVLIVLLKALTGLRMEWIAVGAIALMILYAYLVSSKGVGKLRADQAGDNCYYLGLIYTLSSLAYAIFTFDPSETATVIVQGFGVALATTILGLILRVFFNQSRADIHDIEEDVRFELVEAASRVKSQLTQVSEGFADFSLGLQQSMNEVQQAAAKSIEDSSKKSVDVVEQLASSAGESLQSQAEEFKEQVAALTKATNTSKNALERHSTSLEKLTEQQQSSAESLETIKETVAATAAIGEELKSQQQAMAAMQVAMEDVGKKLLESSMSLGSATQGTVSSLAQLAAQLKERVAELEAAPTKTMDPALAAIARAAERLEASIDSVAQKHDDVRQNIEAQSESLLEKIAQHNAALEEQLERSRDGFNRVQDGLVSVVDNLRAEVGRQEQA